MYTYVVPIYGGVILPSIGKVLEIQVWRLCMCIYVNKYPVDDILDFLYVKHFYREIIECTLHLAWKAP